MLQVEHLSVFYGITEVLRDVSFSLPAGKVYALLGGNGSGKTTVINSLSGMVRPRSGSIKLLGRELIGCRVDQIIAAGMTQVPQGREVFYHMSVQENLEMGAATRPNGPELRRDIEEMCELFPRLAEKRKQPAGGLSGGEQQQVAIARALMSRPELLLMDEPSVGLSPVVVEQLVATVKMLNEKRGLTILIVEQNVGVAAAVASIAYVLKDGEIAYTGPGPELIGNPEVLSSYLGR